MVFENPAAYIKYNIKLSRAPLDLTGFFIIMVAFNVFNPFCTSSQVGMKENDCVMEKEAGFQWNVPRRSHVKPQLTKTWKEWDVC